MPKACPKAEIPIFCLELCDGGEDGDVVLVGIDLRDVSKIKHSPAVNGDRWRVMPAIMSSTIFASVLIYSVADQAVHPLVFWYGFLYGRGDGEVFGFYFSDVTVPNPPYDGFLKFL